jgi:hypothetical protein
MKPIAEDFARRRTEESSTINTGHDAPTPRAAIVPTRRVETPMNLHVTLAFMCS